MKDAAQTRSALEEMITDLLGIAQELHYAHRWNSAAICGKMADQLASMLHTI